MEAGSLGAAFVGGLLIGLAATVVLAVEGRVAGISGILSQAWRPQGSQNVWRWAFLGGLLGGGLLVGHLAPQWIGLPPAAVGTPQLIVAGLAVGYGTRWGNGCTSGHGICGVARLSPRSLIATATFIGAGMLTVWLVNLMAQRGCPIGGGF